MGQIFSWTGTMANFKNYSNLPVVVILGATGAGKSKLSIELAKRYNGEIISADSMQVYEGLDIVTNKVTQEEQSDVIHHFISCIDPLSKYTVVDFRNRALPIIKNLHEKKKLPIIVGGTNYYIESLLWDVLIKPEQSVSDQLLYDIEKNIDNKNSLHFAQISEKENNLHASNNVEISSENLLDLLKTEITQTSLENVSSDLLHKLLLEVDPEMALTLHPNDKRKIIRSLQVYQQHQCRHSDILSMQRSQHGGSVFGGPLRYKNSVMFWIQCDKTVLDKRLDDRVDKMIEGGLIKELLDFHYAYNQQRLLANPNGKYTEGIFQSIGLKEFHEYLILPEDEKQSKNGIKMYKRAIGALKARTKKYATHQKKWIKNRFLGNPERDVPSVFGLNGTELDCWKENVFDIACDVMNSILEGKSPPHVIPLPVDEHIPDIQILHRCDICNKVIIGQKSWEAHLVSKKHYRMKQSKKRKLACTN